MPRPLARRITLEEVAKVAGVSRATVSRVVNGVASVDQALRQAVERAISTTGYLPNLAARSLVTRRANAIALVLPKDDEVLGDPFFGRVVTGVMSVLAPTDVHLVLVKAGPGTGERMIAGLRGGRLDGALLVHTDQGDPLRQLVGARVPVVLWGPPPRPMSITYVDVNQSAGAALAAGHLVGLNRRRIATITGSLDSPAGADRLTGFHAAMAELGQPDIGWAEGDFTRDSGTAAMERLLAEHPGVDGVFVASDLMAQGALAVLRRAGRTVPDDVAIVGFDDSSAALNCDPPLTTVRQPVEDMAAEMTRQLLRQIADPDAPVSTVIFEPKLVVRQSA